MIEHNDDGPIVRFDLHQFIADVTQDIIEIFSGLDMISLHGSMAKFNEFRPVTTGFLIMYETLSHLTGIEEKIPLLEDLENIYDAYHEEKINEEEAWAMIREIIYEYK